MADTKIISKRRELLYLAIIVLLAGFLRLYRIDELTEFLGDQGRTGLVIYQAWQEKKLPLAGPTVLTGEHLGPAFYYLVGPVLILANFNPLAGAVAMAMYGVIAVLLLYFLLNKLVSQSTAFTVSILYATVPSIVKADRTLWEPTLVPFFVILFFLAAVNIHKEKNLSHFALLGVSAGVLVQLHYPNVFYFFLLILLGLFKLRGLLVGVIFFFIPLIPFLIYEAQYGFEDIRGILLTFLSSSVSSPSNLLVNFFDYSGRLIGAVIPAMGLATVIVFLAIAVFWKPSVFKLAFAGIFVLGLMLISKYKGVVYNHYLNFLLPIPFILLALTLETVKKFFLSYFWITISALLLIWNFSRTDIFDKGSSDVYRTQLLTQKIVEEVRDDQFSFTVISSRSFSDLHYRYMFRLQNVKPEPIKSNDYKKLFLICEYGSCPQGKNLYYQRQIQTTCFDPICRGPYPTFTLDPWRLTREEAIAGAKLYSFERK